MTIGVILDILISRGDEMKMKGENLKWVWEYFGRDAWKFSAWMAKQGATPEANAYKMRLQIERKKLKKGK